MKFHNFIFVIHRLLSMTLLLSFLFCSSLYADDFYVSTNGIDSSARDGLSWESAWASLAYACEQIPGGAHHIHLGEGEFVANRTAKLKSGFTLSGVGAKGEKKTRLIASTSWELSEIPSKDDISDEFLLTLEKVNSVSIHDLILCSEPNNRITGAIYCIGSEEVSIHDVYVHDFRWAGLHLELSNSLDIHDCHIENASTQRDRYHNGLIRTRWIKHSEIHHNRIVSTEGGGYGYKGGGHENVRIHHNRFDVVGGFAIESAHENEFGVEIDHNYANRCISIPKGGQGADPNERGYEYSFWIHNNYLTDSYTIEGPRNHLRLSHNYIHIEKTNGRVYTHHGGKNHGPIWIHHNIVENVDRGFVWMNRGLAENIHVYNNTVFLADAGSRTGSVFGAYSRERLNNWVVKNNIFVAAWSQPRILIPHQRGVDEKIEVKNNICINLKNVPSGNFSDVDPGLKRDGDKPTPFYLPLNENSFVVDRGVDVGFPFEGKKPDIGVFEWGEELSDWELSRED